MIEFSSVTITTTDPVELFAASTPSNFAFTTATSAMSEGNPLISANADGTNACIFGFESVTGFVGTAYLQLPTGWLPTTMHVTKWNAE